MTRQGRGGVAFNDEMKGSTSEGTKKERMCECGYKHASCMCIFNEKNY